MLQQKRSLDASSLKVFDNAAAGHEGVLSDQDGELIIKPCTDAERDFYQQTVVEHPDFAELMPTYMGTLELGAPALPVEGISGHDIIPKAQAAPRLHGAKIATRTAIVLDNLEHGFTYPNVLDLKLGARLYADGTNADKAARLDKVASETTSGSLHFRITGMKVWNGTSLDSYDKFYGRKFTAKTVNDGFATFFAGLATSLEREDAIRLLKSIAAEIAKVQDVLERAESRMYGASVLIVYEGDSEALRNLMSNDSETTKVNERASAVEVDDEGGTEEEDEDLEEEEPVACKVKMIDFAHAQWTPGLGMDDNVMQGLKNVGSQMAQIISQLNTSMC